LIDHVHFVLFKSLPFDVPCSDMMAQPSPSASGASTPSPSLPLESLDFGHPTPHAARPFKHHRPSKPRNPRRNKTLKQILLDEQKALAAALAASDPTLAAAETKSAKSRATQQKLRAEGLQWSDIDAPPSLLPQKKFCDITGLEGRYTDPKSKLRFYNSEVYAVIQTLPPSIDQEVSVPCFWLSLNLVSGGEECECCAEVKGMREDH
jgi:INO80 complex subunit C